MFFKNVRSQQRPGVCLDDVIKNQELQAITIKQL